MGIPFDFKAGYGIINRSHVIFTPKTGEGGAPLRILANDLKRQYDLHAPEYEAKALEVLRSGWYILGKEVEAFEKEWAAMVGTKYCVGLASGLDALWIAFKLLGIGPGDEVIVSANAYIACVMGITINGATPVFVEPDEYDNIDASRIEAAVTPPHQGHSGGASVRPELRYGYDRRHRPQV